MDYKKYIKEVGISKISTDLGVEYETVRLWARGHIVPKRVNIAKLIKHSGGKLTTSDFFQDIEV